jgi:hypothetical protein
MAKIDDTLDADQTLRRWSIEQVITLHSGAGLTCAEMIRQAKELADHVKGPGIGPDVNFDNIKVVMRTI